MSKPYHIVPSKNGKWAVWKNGALRASRVFSSKKEAIGHGKKLSKKEHTILYVHRSDGVVQERNSYMLVINE